ncbi:MAG: DNRLRE domain-containing protein, partial [Methylococcales bacterium]|nr:DNRLRE domain-containing protein [Methylococcales bacterium]
FSDYKIRTATGDCSGLGCDPTQAQVKGIFHNEIWRYSGGAYEKISGDTPLNPWDGYWCAALVESTGKSPQIIIASATLQPPIAGNWKLEFQEEFNGNSLDPAKWRVGQHHLGIAGNAGNSAEQVSVSGGNLKLLAEAKPVTFRNKDGQLWDFDYSSGEISTFQQFRQRYGYFEARIKYDVMQGVWPAFWTMPDRGDYGPKNRSYESFMRFDLSGVSAPINSAKLKVKVTGFDSYNNPSNIIVNMTIHKLLSDNEWDETAVNWGNKPAYDPTWLDQKLWKKPTSGGNAQLASASQETLEDAGYTPEEYNQAQAESNKNNLYPSGLTMQEVISVSSAESAADIGEIHVGDVVEIDVTNYVKSQLAANKSTAGFALVDTFLRDHGISFGSREAEAGDRPQLVIDEAAPVHPVADASVREGFPTTNYGSTTALTVRDPWKSTSSTYNGGMEVDIMESLGVWGSNTQHATHWDGYVKPEKGGDWQHENSGLVALSSSDYHTYGMSWQPGRIDFYIDGIKSGWAFVNPRTSSIASYILLSHQLGGWPGSGNTIPAGFESATMLVDHVRAWSGSPSP